MSIYYSQQPYGGLFDNTSGIDVDDAMVTQIAEAVCNEVSAESQDTGAVSNVPLAQRAERRIGQLFGRIGVRPPPGLVDRVVAKAAPTLAGRLASMMPQQRQPMYTLPAQALVQPIMGPVAGKARKPITNLDELKQRVGWAQLVALTTNPTTLAIGAVNVAATLTVSRTGLVLDWLTNASNAVLANSLTYAQQPNTIFSATPLSAWAPTAANPSPIQPVFVNQPATFNVLLSNTNPAAAEILSWTMSGIPNENFGQATLDPDVMAFLQGRGVQLAMGAQAGFGASVY